jgi:hypothetical protein
VVGRARVDGSREPPECLASKPPRSRASPLYKGLRPNQAEVKPVESALDDCLTAGSDPSATLSDRMTMLAITLWVMIAYLTVGLLACLFARRGWPDDWDETLLASVLAPPVLALLAAASAAGFLWSRLATTPPTGAEPTS